MTSGAPETARRAVPGWLAGAVAMTLTLIAIGFVSIGFYASGGGLVIAGVMAISIGMAVAAIVEPARAGSNAGIVAFYVFALGAFCAKIVADAIDRKAWVAMVVAIGLAAAAAAVGTLSEQTALQRRPATQVAPIIFAIELLVPVALAVLVVGEDWERSSLAGILLALALVVGGALSLARTPTVARLLEPA